MCGQRVHCADCLAVTSYLVPFLSLLVSWYCFEYWHQDIYIITLHYIQLLCSETGTLAAIHVLPLVAVTHLRFVFPLTSFFLISTDISRAAVRSFFVTHLHRSDLFDAGREVCDDFEDVVCFGEILTDIRFLCTNHSDGQTRTCGRRESEVRFFFRKYRSDVIE